ncbi:uncharacterized protein BO88DRAFT_429974 [Aspergillus vadensis CBS 113365]|uniref:Uncharacterized protein n=1 Tax=Aspergillus vadensis (strain CBS 113365 / IMI 142717 / IBT 24658) TaxID=1448311 RepID=A0A319C597_ASPVC|nr:hypothetical protein BO88DRAFT_429974 [Aspergillus vadensis CBS 113365]PYH63952.1 hypothetical protein BO88DRAFT_429974 [Aspergillus vadensis CBS 113365]
MGCASDVAIPRDSGAERESPTMIPADVTCGERNETTDDRSCTLPSQTAKSYLPADNLAGESMAYPWYSMPWATDPYSQGTLHGSFWDWTWSQSEYLTGSETDGFLHPSIPAQQPGGATVPELKRMPFWGDHSQELYPPDPSFDQSEPIPLSVALGLFSILETVPPRVSRLPCVQHGEEASLALPTQSPMLLPPRDPLAPVSAALPMIDFHRRTAACIKKRSLLPPWLLQTMTDYQETEMRPFDNVGANSQKLSRNVTVPEGQAEQRHST